MKFFAPAVENLIDEFAKLPGIGRKSAQRLAFHVLNLPKEQAESFAEAIVKAKETVHTCPKCQNLTDQELCPICANPARDGTTICVVADPKDIIAFEKTREYKGLYHVLHGTISPLNHIGPDEIRIRELLNRVAEEDIQEVIIATNPDTEGEATAMYIARLLAPFGIRISRLAYGIPVGGHLEYIDEVTLMRALEGRQTIG
ncbi:MAG: recombination mediator RecR [Butyricicoccus sp.]